MGANILHKLKRLNFNFEIACWKIECSFKVGFHYYIFLQRMRLTKHMSEEITFL